MQTTPVGVAALVLSAISFSPSHAQNLRCLNPDAYAKGVCTIDVTKVDSAVSVEIKLQAEPGANVNVKLDKGNGSVTLTTPPRSNNVANAIAPSDGVVRYTWTGFLGDAPQELTATATHNASSSVLPIRIASAVRLSDVTINLPEERLYGYSERQLQYPVEATLSVPLERCNSTIVVFRASGDGSATPDTVRAERQNNSECVASTWWRLGKGTGRQILRASVGGAPNNFTTATAVARATPRIFAGVAVTTDFHEYSIVKRDSTIRHVTVEHGDTSEVVDTVVRKDRVENQDTEWHFSPTLGADFTLGRRFESFRGSIAISLTAPTRDFYAGFSVIQPFAGVAYEALGIDLHVVTHWGRRAVTKLEMCPNNDAAECEAKETFLFLGIGAMATVDQTSLLSTFGNIFK